VGLQPREPEEARAQKLKRRLAFLARATPLALGATLYLPTAFAHPPDDPFDDDVFTPIRGGGPKIGLELVAEGLIA
jgi:hypothetical protein